MMEPVFRVDGNGANPVIGRALLDWPKLTWNFGNLLIALIFAPMLFSWSALLMFLCFTYMTLLVGHSVGMHRMMIHRSFSCHKPIEYVLIYIGVLVGVAGPFGILRVHDIRDWAQRQSAAHDYFTHRRWLLVDLIWQLGNRFEFAAPPKFLIEAEKADDPFYRFLEATWRLHQIPLAIILYYFGGWSWVVWGVCARVSLSVIGHWTITYYCHNPGPGRWHVHDAAVQASNVPGLGLLTYGECWHNNHHAFPESARIGLDSGQADPAWWVINAMKKMGLVQNIRLPRAEALRSDIAECAGQ